MKTATALLCSEKAPSISLIHPLKEMLLRQLKVKDSDNSLISSVKEGQIVKDLKPRYTDEATVHLLLESSCLDPKFKKMPYIDDVQCRDVFSSLAMKAVLNYEPVKIKTEKDDQATSNDTETPPPPLPNLELDTENDTPVNAAIIESEQSREVPDHSPEKKRKKSSAFSELFGEVFVTKVEEAKSLNIKVDKEITDYKSENSIPLDSDPLQWWKENEHKYPLLSSQAKKYLCIPATSVASERIFSTAGDLVTAQRSCLSSYQVDRLIFLKKNYVL